MKFLNSKKIFFSLFALGITIPFFLVFAQPPSTSTLEVSYPTLVPGVAPPQSVQVYLPNYIRYLYTAAVALGGLISFASLLMGGGKYLTSVGNPARMKDARDQILSGLLGLLLILGSYVLVNVINPEITQLYLPSITPHKEGIIIYNVSCADLQNAAVGISPQMLGLPELLNLPDNIVWTNIKNTTNNISLPNEPGPFPVRSFVTFHSSEELTIDFCSLPDFADCHGTNQIQFNATDCVDITQLGVTSPLDVESIKFKWYRPGVWLFAYGNNNDIPDPRKPRDDCGRDNCYLYTRTSLVSLPAGIFDHVQAIALVNSAEEKFGAILHNIPGANPKEKGWAQIFLPDDSHDIALYLFDSARDASSLTVFRMPKKGAGNYGVTICRDPRCEEREYERSSQREYMQPGLRINLGAGSTDITSNICSNRDNITTYVFNKRDDSITAGTPHCPQNIVFRAPENNLFRNEKWRDLRTGGQQEIEEFIQRRNPSGISAVYIDDGSGFLVLLYDTGGHNPSNDEIADQNRWDVALLQYDLPDLSTIHMNERTTMLIIVRSQIMAQ